jgi:hypothetical protein
VPLEHLPLPERVLTSCCGRSLQCVFLMRLTERRSSSGSLPTRRGEALRNASAELRRSSGDHGPQVFGVQLPHWCERRNVPPSAMFHAVPCGAQYARLV